MWQNLQWLLLLEEQWFLEWLKCRWAFRRILESHLRWTRTPFSLSPGCTTSLGCTTICWAVRAFVRELTNIFMNIPLIMTDMFVCLSQAFSCGERRHLEVMLSKTKKNSHRFHNHFWSAYDSLGIVVQCMSWVENMLTEWHCHCWCTFYTYFEHFGKGFDVWTAQAFLFRRYFPYYFEQPKHRGNPLKQTFQKQHTGCLPHLLANALLCCIINLHGEAESWEFLHLQSCSF